MSRPSLTFYFKYDPGYDGSGLRLLAITALLVISSYSLFNINEIAAYIAG